MSLDPDYVGRTSGITPTAPPLWRRLDGAMGIFWQAKGTSGAQGYYLSDHPRISVFFDDVASIRISNDPGAALQPGGRPLARILYIPAGLPMWSRFTADLAFSHLDIHLHRDRLQKLLVPALGRTAALDVLARPVETSDSAATITLAGLLRNELRAPARHPLHAEALVASMVTGLLDLRRPAARAEARLTPRQMHKLVTRFRAGGGQGLTVPEMARAVGLSESWFSHLFKNTTGTTPLQWQLRQRVELAQGLLAGSGISLADVAGRLGFTDQAHLTKVFRQVTGETPAAWRRAQDRVPAALERPRGRG